MQVHLEPDSIKGISMQTMVLPTPNGFVFLHRRDEPGRTFDLDPNIPSFKGIKHEHKPSEEVMVDLNGGGTKPTASFNGGSTKPTVSFNGGSTKPTVSFNGGSTKPTVSSNGGGTKPTVNPSGSGAMDHKKMKVMEGSPNIPSSTGTSLTVKVYSTTYPPSTTSPSLSISIPASQATNILSPSTPNLASYSPTMVPSQQKSYPTTIAAIVLAAIVVVMGIILFVLFVRRSRTRRPSFVIALEKGSAFSLTEPDTELERPRRNTSIWRRWARSIPPPSTNRTSVVFTSVFVPTNTGSQRSMKSTRSGAFRPPSAPPTAKIRPTSDYAYYYK